MIVLPTPLQTCLIAEALQATIFVDDEVRSFPSIEVKLLGNLTAYIDVTVRSEHYTDQGDYLTPAYSDLVSASLEIDDAVLIDDNDNEWQLRVNTAELTRLII